MDKVRGVGRAMVAAVLLMVGGVLNVIYAPAAIGDSKSVVADTHYVFGLSVWIISGLTALGPDDPWAERHRSARPTMTQTPRSSM